MTNGRIPSYFYKKGKKNKIILASLIIILASCQVTAIAKTKHFESYNYPNYVCRHMAQDLEDRIESFGVPVIIVRGRNETKDMGHVWIKVFGIEIDSITLERKDNRKLYPDNITEYWDYYTYAKTCFSKERFNKEILDG